MTRVLRTLAVALTLAFAAALVMAQIPGPGPLVIGQPIQGGTNGDCLYVNVNTLGQQVCVGGGITALTGDVTASGAGSVAATLATVNSNTGAFGSSTAIPNLTVNGKGLITAAGTNAVIAPAGTLTGATLASGVTASSLTSFGASPTLAGPTITGLLTSGAMIGGSAPGSTLKLTSTSNASPSGDNVQIQGGTIFFGNATGSSNPLTVNGNGGVIIGTFAATTSTGELALIKISASGTAPGAGILKLSIVAGTNVGTCKIIAYAGTSTTPTTLLDNVGGGC